MTRNLALEMLLEEALNLAGDVEGPPFGGNTFANNVWSERLKQIRTDLERIKKAPLAPVVPTVSRRSCDGCDLYACEEDLFTAAREFAATSIAMDTSDAVLDEELRNARESLIEYAFALAAAELETEFSELKLPPFAVGDEPSAFDAIQHLTTKANPASKVRR